MEITSVIEIQKKGIVMHRISYVLFLLERVLFHFISDSIEVKNTIALLSIVFLCEIMEEIFYYNNFFQRISILKLIRYIQCVLTTFIFIFLQISEESGVMILSLFLMFVLDFLISMQPESKISAAFFVVLISFPVLTIILTMITFTNNNQWLFILFDMLLLFVVLMGVVFLSVEYVLKVNQTIIDQRHKFRNIVEKNENILNMQEKLKNTNEQLNIQKLDLQLANKQIVEANNEMVAQTEILRYISMSFDVAKISDQITDAIMHTKELEFCAVFIKRGVYLNKYANYVVKTDIRHLQTKIKDNMEEIYFKMTEQNKSEVVFYDNIKTQFPFLEDADINSVYIRVLGLYEDTYGLFMLGSRKKRVFNDKMSFYNAVIAQYDIAINNAKIYNEMQNMARKDGLTGINNRIYFSELLKKEVAKVYAHNGCISVALFDIDKFKNVNDTYGHLAGDEVIKRIASVTEACIDKYHGFVCRYGGEEFVVVLPERNLEVAHPIIKELFEELCRQVVIYNDKEIHLSVSIGLTAYPEVCKDIDDLLKRADWCMYYAKEHGRCQINVDDGSIERE